MISVQSKLQHCKTFIRVMLVAIWQVNAERGESLCDQSSWTTSNAAGQQLQPVALQLNRSSYIGIKNVLPMNSLALKLDGHQPFAFGFIVFARFAQPTSSNILM